MCENIGIIVDGEGVDLRGFMYIIVWIIIENFSSIFKFDLLVKINLYFVVLVW